MEAGKKIDHIDPRETCLTDFKEWIRGKFGAHHRMILLANMNQSTDQVAAKYSLNKFITDHEMDETLPDTERVPSTSTGTKVIDHILTKNIAKTNITNSGQLPMGLGFHNSNHRGLFTNIDMREELELCLESQKQRRSRKLVSKKNKQRMKYMKSLRQLLLDHNAINSNLIRKLQLYHPQPQPPKKLQRR